MMKIVLSGEEIVRKRTLGSVVLWLRKLSVKLQHHFNSLSDLLVNGPAAQKFQNSGRNTIRLRKKPGIHHMIEIEMTWKVAETRLSLRALSS